MNTIYSRQRQQQQQQQPRSHSIGGLELNFSGCYQRPSPLVAGARHVPPELDQQQHRQRYGVQTPIYQLGHQQRQQQQPRQQSHHQQVQLSARVPLSSGYAGRNCDNASRYQNGQNQRQKKQIYASSKCPNYRYLEYQHHHNQQQQKFQQPVAFATPIGCSGSSIYAHQSLANRAMDQANQSPVRQFSGASNGHHSKLAASLQQLRAGHHTSSLSLASQAAPSSPSSSSYIIIEDKLQNEIRKLQGELKSEREKNEALNSQLNINSNLMAAFEQSLTTLNSRLRQLAAMNERKDQEIGELRLQLELLRMSVEESRTDTTTLCRSRANESQKVAALEAPIKCHHSIDVGASKSGQEEQGLAKVVEDLRRQLIEKDRLLTDTRLEALSAAHQLEQLESRLDRGRGSVEVGREQRQQHRHEHDRSPSDNDDGPPTDSAHFSETNSGSQIGCDGDNAASYSDHNASDGQVESTNRGTNNGCQDQLSGSLESNSDNHSSHSSSDLQDQSSASREANNPTNDLSDSILQQFNAGTADNSPIDRLMECLLSSSS